MDKPLSSGLKNLFIVHAVAAIIFGLLFLIYPALWVNLAGRIIISNELWRLLGAAVFTFGVSSWLGFKAKSWESVRIVVLMEGVWCTLATVILLYYLIRWQFPTLYWANTVIFAGFALAFVYFYIKNKE